MTKNAAAIPLALFLSALALPSAESFLYNQEDPNALPPLTENEVQEITELNTKTFGQQSRFDRSLVRRALKMREGGANFLIFGTGRDSAFWQRCNPKGRTVFLEDNPEWASADPTLPEVYLVTYHSAPHSAWKQLLFKDAGSGTSGTWQVQRHLEDSQQQKLAITGPPQLSSVWNTTWDVILIDGPAGYGSDTPGRMAPIFQSSRLVERQRRRDPARVVDIFVHDFDRSIEREWSFMFLCRSARFLNYHDLMSSWMQGQKVGRKSYQNDRMAWYRAP